MILPYVPYSQDSYEQGDKLAWQQLINLIIFMTEHSIDYQAIRQKAGNFLSAHYETPNAFKDFLLRSAERVYALLSLLEQRFPEGEWVRTLKLAERPHWRYRKLGFLWEVPRAFSHPFFNPADSFRLNKTDLESFRTGTLRESPAASTPLYRSYLYLASKRFKQTALLCLTVGTGLMATDLYSWVKEGGMEGLREDAKLVCKILLESDGSNQAKYEKKPEPDPYLEMSFRPRLEQLEKERSEAKTPKERGEVEEKIEALKEFWFSKQPRAYQESIQKKDL